ncbi:MAG: acyl-CoA thioesterase [Oceanospirillaceae bacterium]|nr:acyl-CoA thioesterase [Oceanospirillaceae bacterium]MBT12574.1 acyl-CoA thioesterase [Oceanospirillaceae bacterium]|tara:strand:- start:20938 stop:21738 length:801 start_codon:yes stop_codon:yes gene_type:complete
MSFNHYLEQATGSDSLQIDPSWGQGRTTFGGLSAALSLARCQQQITAGSLRSLAVNFCGPLQTATPFTLSDQMLRAGNSVSHIQGDVIQNDQLCTRISACYGNPRATDILVDSPAGDLPQAGSGQALPFIKGLTPDFTQHIDFRYCGGGLPFTNSPHNHLKGWMRFSDTSGPMSDPHMVALIDAWPPTLLQKMKSFGPCASISWNLEIIRSPAALPQPLEAGDWLWYEAEIRQAHDGYGHTEARICAPDGTLLTLSRQLVAVYDKR